MPFVRKKIADDNIYYVLVESKRSGSSVAQEVLRRFPNYIEALAYCKEHDLPCPSPDIISPSLASRITDKLGRLNAHRPIPSETMESLNKKFELELTYHSNAIEGNRLSLKETYLVLEKGMTIHGKSVKEHLEATNHKEALQRMEQLVHGGEITEPDILRLHSIIMDKVRPEWSGVYRKGPVAVALSDLKPPHHSLIPSFMTSVISLLNSRSEGIDAIKQASLTHHRFVHIHPFWDGNGRVGRILMNIKLMQAGFPPAILTRRERMFYYDVLEDADKGDLGPLTTIIAKGVERSLDLYLDVLEGYESPIS